MRLVGIRISFETMANDLQQSLPSQPEKLNIFDPESFGGEWIVQI